mmetsp:Transcript_23770/g.55383  ORF Transcript_23770/g.55383 Transcript_23770/m.55383 type:complete len:262 (+) Transcript_23770:99-884(+)
MVASVRIQEEANADDHFAPGGSGQFATRDHSSAADIFLTAPRSPSAPSAGPHSRDEAQMNYTHVLADVSRLLAQPESERLANLQRYANCMTVRFRRNRTSQLEQDIQALMPSSLQKVEDVWEYTSCSICLVDFGDGEELRRTPCSGGHVFHPKCLRGWLDRSNQSCPVCRGSTDGPRQKGHVKPSAEALAEYVMRRMRGGKVEMSISDVNQQKATDIVRRMRDPLPEMQVADREKKLGTDAIPNGKGAYLRDMVSTSGDVD